jgi:hypothetical protein
VEPGDLRSLDALYLLEVDKRSVLNAKSIVEIQQAKGFSQHVPL